MLNNPPPARISGFRAKDWIKISQSPAQIVNTQLGEKVEMECEVLGSPAPEIQWFRGNQLVQQVRLFVILNLVLDGISHSHYIPCFLFFQTERSVINNELRDSFHDRAGLAKIKSRLIIDCVTPEHEGFYTCVARAGVKKIKSQPSLLLIEGGNSDTCKEPQNQRLQAPRIISWNPTAMENMGVDVLLPCAAVGNPTPEVYWLDQDNNVVNNFRYRVSLEFHHRMRFQVRNSHLNLIITIFNFQVLNNGDLAIYRLAWPDMGQYRCVAENSLGRDSVTTFIYPVLVSISITFRKNLIPPRLWWFLQFKQFFLHDSFPTISIYKSVFVNINHARRFFLHNLTFPHKSAMFKNWILRSHGTLNSFAFSFTWSHDKRERGKFAFVPTTFIEVFSLSVATFSL